MSECNQRRKASKGGRKEGRNKKDQSGKTIDQIGRSKKWQISLQVPQSPDLVMLNLTRMKAGKNEKKLNKS